MNATSSIGLLLRRSDLDGSRNIEAKTAPLSVHAGNPGVPADLRFYLLTGRIGGGGRWTVRQQEQVRGGVLRFYYRRRLSRIAIGTAGIAQIRNTHASAGRCVGVAHQLSLLPGAMVPAADLTLVVSTQTPGFQRSDRGGTGLMP